jgi:hypothetical protein
MKAKRTFRTIKIRWVIAFIMMSACVEQISFDVPQVQSLTVVEGTITDDPGPYTVKISRGQSLDSDTSFYDAIQNAAVTLYDDEGNEENFTEISPGVYKTGGVIQGQVGRSYHIRFETADGKIFESAPDKINPVGELEDIRYEFEERSEETDITDKNDVFKIYVDAKAGTSDDNYVRWKFKGTYKVLTNPELRKVKIMEFTIMDPLPCSGYRVAPAPNGGILEKFGECTCCTCWVNQFETAPQLSDEQFISGNQFSNIKVGEVPINSSTFYDKYLVEVEQMSLSRKSFEFFKLIRAQKEGAASLFQPASGEIRGNVSAVNSSNETVVGLFWATSVKRKSLYIHRSEVPYVLPPIVFVTEACTSYYPHSSTTEPAVWE